MISYIIPTHNRPETLAQTLAAIGRIDPHTHDRLGGAEVVVADNASRFPVTAPGRLANGATVTVIYRPTNEGAAARNAAAERARGEWLVMLDDDSHPLDGAFVEGLLDAPGDVGAIASEILLPDGTHEAGGLPEVFTGCGVAIRRDVFLGLGGYDGSFGYYAEEYDLSARMILAGLRVAYGGGFRVLHRKVEHGRDFGAIVGRLVRNNGWCAARYAPEAERDAALAETVARYRRIAEKEGAVEGYEAGLAELNATISAQPRREMSVAQWDRFTGLAAAREGLAGALGRIGARRVRVVDEGKNCWAVRRVLGELGAEIAPGGAPVDALVVGTLSPGPMEDAARQRVTSGLPVVTPWRTGWATRHPVRAEVFSAF